ncbi:MAG: zinc ribbon domain-containing protein [bacterium]|nr:zinc ribbon domain-containing protein [bacterium]
MECRVCGADISEDARFCPSCGSKTDSEESEMEVIEAAVAEAEEVFYAELESDKNISDDEDGHDIEGEEEVIERRKSARERMREFGDAVKQKADDVSEFGRKVGDTTARTVKKTKEIHADVTQKVGNAYDRGKEIHADVSQKVGNAYDRGKEIQADVTQKVGVAYDKTVEFSGDVAVTAQKVGTGVKKAAKKTKETMEELGQVGVIITQRALDVVRASLRAVEIVDNYLEKKNSQYEVGNFITGVALPPYLEIEFHKRKDDMTTEEKIIIRMLRESDHNGKSMEEMSELLKKEKGEEKQEPNE